MAAKLAVKVLAFKANRAARNAASAIKTRTAAATALHAVTVTVQAMHSGAATTAIPVNHRQVIAVKKGTLRRAFLISYHECPAI